MRSGRAIDERVLLPPRCSLPAVIATPADLVDALFRGGDAALTDAAWRRLVKHADRVSPGEGEDLAQDWAHWMLEHPVPLAAARTLQHWGGLDTSLRQHRERRRRRSAGLEEHPSPETEQLREGLRKLLAKPPFVSSGGGRTRTFRLDHLPAGPVDPADLRLTFDVAPSGHDDRARTLVPRAALQRFAAAWLARPETPRATLAELVRAAAQAGGHPFPADRLEQLDHQDAAADDDDPGLGADVRRLAVAYLRTLPVRRLKAAILLYGRHLLLEEAAALLGVGKSTVGNESKAFTAALKEALAPLGDEPATRRMVASIVEAMLGGARLGRWADDVGEAPEDGVWNDLAAGRFGEDER